MLDALDLRELLGDELVQRKESGYDVFGLSAEVEATVENLESSPREIERLYNELDGTHLRSGWGYEEPSALEDILAVAPGVETGKKPSVGVLSDRVHAAWLGRCAGCNLGKPVEGGWGRDKLRRYLEMCDAFPLSDYIPALDPMPDGFVFNPSWKVATRGRVRGWPATMTPTTRCWLCGYWRSTGLNSRAPMSGRSGSWPCPSTWSTPLSESLIATSSTAASALYRQPPQPLSGMDRRSDTRRHVWLRFAGGPGGRGPAGLQ